MKGTKRKRFLAALLSAVVVFTSVDMTSLAAYISPDVDGKYTASAEELLAVHYELSEEETQILTSDVIKGLDVKYDVTGVSEPTEQDGLIAVDTGTNTIYIKEYQNWKPKAAAVAAEGQEPVPVTLTKKDVTYNKVKYPYSAKLTDSPANYSVQVTYALDVSIPEAEQRQVLGILDNLAEGIGNLDSLAGLDTELNNVRDLLNAMEDYRETLSLAAPSVLSAAEEANEALSVLLDEALLNYEIAKSDKQSVDFLLKDGSAVKDSIGDVREKLAALLDELRALESKGGAGDEFKNAVLTDLCDILEELAGEEGSLTALAARPWTLLDKTVQNAFFTDGADFSGMEAAVHKLTEKDWAGTQLDSTFTAAECTISSHVNRTNIKVTVQIETAPEEAVNVDSTAPAELETSSREAVLIVNKGTSAEEIAAAVKTKTEELSADIDMLHYTSDLEKVLADTKEASDDEQAYTITFTPNTYTVTLTENGSKEEPISVEHYYGTKLRLTAPEDTDRSYDYTVVTGQAPEEGQEDIRTTAYYNQDTELVVEDTMAVTRVLGEAKQTYRVWGLLAEEPGVSLSEAAKKVLESPALESETVTFRVPGEAAIGVLSTSDGVSYTVVLQEIASGLADAKWAPSKAVLMNDESEVSDVAVTITPNENHTYTASWTLSDVTMEFTHLSVDYELKAAEVTAAQLQGLDKLTEAVKAQQKVLTGTDIVSAKKVYDKITDMKDLMNRTVLSALQAQLTGDAKEAAKKILDSVSNDGCWGNSELALYTYLNVLNDNDWKLGSYYQGETAENIKTQAKRLADNLALIAGEDSNLQEVLDKLAESNGLTDLNAEKVRELAADLSDLAADMKTLAELEKETGVALDTSSQSEFAALFQNLLAAKDGEFSAVAAGSSIVPVKAYREVCRNADGRVSLAIQVQAGTKSAKKVLSFPASTSEEVKAIGTDGLARIAAAVAALEDELGLTAEEKAYYNVPSSLTEGEAAKYNADSAFYTNDTAAVIYEPKTYQVKVDGVKDPLEIFTYAGTDASYSVLLPAYSEEAEEDTYYLYTIKKASSDGSQAAVTRKVENGTTGSYTFTKADLALFTGENNSYTISREECSKTQEGLDSFVKILNDELTSAGVNEAKFIPVKNEKGKFDSIILRLTVTKDLEVKGALTGIGNALTKLSYDYIGIGKGSREKADFKYTDAEKGLQIDPQALVDMLLYGGASSERILASVNEDGTVNEIVLKEGCKALTTGILADGETLGGKFVESALYLGADKEHCTPIDLHVTIAPGENNVLKDTRKLINDASEYLTFNLGSGSVELNGTMPENVYKVYLSVMILLGQTDLESIEDRSLQKDVELVEGLLRDLLVDSEDEVDAQTVENTLKYHGVDVELDDYSGIINAALKTIRQLLKGDENGDGIPDGNPYVKEKGADYASNYGFTVVYDAENQLKKIDAYEDFIQSMLTSTVLEVPVELNVWNNKTEYEALVLDLKAEGVLNKLVYTEDLAETLKRTHGATAVVLLKDIVLDPDETMSIANRTMLNLNGKTITGHVYGDKLRIVDSTLAAEEAGGIVGTVDGADVRISAGTYSEKLRADMLGKNYVQDEKGTVRSRYYETEVDEAGNVTVTLSTEYLKDIADSNLEVFGMDLASELLFNIYTNAAVTIGDYEIYNFDLPDVTGKFNDLDALASEVIGTVNKEDTIAFIKEVAKELKPAVLAEKLETEGGAVLASYDYTTAPWTLKAEVTEDNRIGLGVKPGSPVTRTVTIKVNEDKALAETVRAAADIVSIDVEKLSLNSLSYTDGELKYDITAKATLGLDLASRTAGEPSDYVSVIAVLLANNADEEKAAKLAEAVTNYEKKYSADEMTALLESMSVGELVEAMKAAEDKDFREMTRSLGLEAVLADAVELEKDYDTVLQIAYDVIAHVDKLVGDKEKVQEYYQKTLGGIRRADGTYGGTLKNSTGSIALTLNMKLFSDDYDSSVQKVIDLIKKIPKEKPEQRTGDLEKGIIGLEEAIELIADAREAYDELSETEKNLVQRYQEDGSSIYERLTNAEGWYAELGLWMSEIPDQEYRNASIKPEIRVYDGATRLKYKTDYTISYRNNKNAYTVTEEAKESTDAKVQKTLKSKAPAVVVKMKRNYSGSVYNYFTIKQLDITQATEYVEGTVHEGLEVRNVFTSVSGKRKTGTPAVYLNGKKLSTSEYTVLYQPKLAAGEEGQQPYTSGEKNEWDILIIGKGKNIAAPVLPEGQNSKTWKWNYNNVLTDAKDADGNPMYYTAKQYMATVTLASSSVKAASIKSQPIAEWVDVNGNAVPVTPSLKLTYKGYELSDGIDYTIISWTNNEKIGTASVTIKGTDNHTADVPYSFTGTRTLKFKITGTSLASSTKCRVDIGKKIADRIYTGEEILLTEKDAEGNGDYALYDRKGTTKDLTDDVRLVEGVDYEVTYSRNVNKGTATIKFTGIGNYYGSVKKTFKIQAAALTQEMQVTAADFTVAYQKGGVKPKDQIVLRYNERELVYNKDYTITWKNHTKVGTAQYYIKGKGNFAGNLGWQYFTIEVADSEAQVTMTAKDVLSNGTAKNGWATSYKTSVTLTDVTTGKKLTAGTDYEKSYTYTYVDADGNVTENPVQELLNSKGKTTGKISIAGENNHSLDYLELAVSVKGKGNYAGLEKTAVYRIYTRSISKAKVSGITSQTYNQGGWELTNPEEFADFKVVWVTGSGKNKVETPLNYGTDYTVTYNKSTIFAGKVTATIQGEGVYGGTKKVTFTIKPANANTSVQKSLDTIKSWFENLF